MMTYVETPALDLVGSNYDVPLVNGSSAPYCNLDYAASTPALTTVWRAVQEFLPWYSSVHRGAGFKSQVSTAVYEGARQALRLFVGARANDAVIFTRNTTDALNLLASALPDETHIIASPAEHHANMLPWRQHHVEYLPFATGPEELLDSLELLLKVRRGGSTLVAITAASNVTGEVWPLAEIIHMAHRFAARVVVDAAQLAAHSPIDMAKIDVDYLALSGHKIYAPFGAGALIGRPDWLSQGDPFLRGGGAVEMVSLDEVFWSAVPARQEAGSPNVVGAVALGVACDSLRRAGMASIAQEESDLGSYARGRLATVAGLEQYVMWNGSHERIALSAWNVRGYSHGEVAAILSAEFGIAVRHGCFCAHPLVLHILHVKGAEAEHWRDEIREGHSANTPGAVRMSLGLGSTRADVDRLTDALRSIVEEGPRWSYRRIGGSYDYVPDPDTRTFPSLPACLAGNEVGFGESS